MGPSKPKPRPSDPPPVGTPVRLAVRGFLKGQHGVVVGRVENDEKARDEQGKPVSGASVNVLLDRPYETGRGPPIYRALALYEWEVEVTR